MAYRTGWIGHEGMSTVYKAPLKMVAHWGESKTVSYAREQSTSSIAAMRGALLLYCSFFQHENRVDLTDCSNLELICLEPCGFVHYSMDTTQERQAPGRPSADLGCACIKLHISWRCHSETCLFIFCHLSPEVYNLDNLFLALCSEYFYIILFH